MRSTELAYLCLLPSTSFISGWEVETRHLSAALAFSKQFCLNKKEILGQKRNTNMELKE